MLKTRLGFARASSLRTLPIFKLLLAATAVMAVGVSGHAFHPAVQNTAQTIADSAPVQILDRARTDIADAVNAPPTNVSRTAELDDGQTFAEMLNDSGASDADAAAAMNALSKVYDMRHMRAGQNVTLTFSHTDRKETLTGAVFQPEATKEIAVARNAAGQFVANVRAIPVVRQRLAAEGPIRSSLYEAGDRAGVPHAIMASLIHIYSHDIDFQRDIHPGDSFKVLYDQPMTTRGKSVGQGDVIYADLNVGGKSHPIYRVMFGDKTVDYFDEHGQSIRRAILRTPVAVVRITSGFGMRMHPILGYTKMHKGVDFGAPTGTPIFAAGDGVIQTEGWVNGYGRYIRIRHNSTLATAYAHMSRFASYVHPGSRVKQGEVIGYVGMTGRATGPHLHFEVLIHGKQVNPLSVNLPTGRKLEGKLLADFRKGQGVIKHEFATIVAEKNAPQEEPRGFIRASASGPAYPSRPSQSCGLRGGC